MGKTKNLVCDHNSHKNYDVIKTEKTRVMFRAHFHYQDKLAGFEFCYLSDYFISFSKYDYL